MKVKKVVFPSVSVVLMLCLSSPAQVLSVSPFSGSLNESFESLVTTPELSNGTGIIFTPVSIMNGEASLGSSIFGGIYSAQGNWSFGLGENGTAKPSDGSKLFGLDYLGAAPATITFYNPVDAFGGYFGAKSFGGNPANFVVKLFDFANVQIGADQFFSYIRPNGDGVLEWHGWQSATPIKSVSFESTGLVVDGLQAVPEPSSYLMISSLSLAGFALLRQGRISCCGVRKAA